jgi:hypothetical protein
MQLAELDEVHYDLEIDGELVRRQLARRIWDARGWATVAVQFQERVAGGAWKPAKVALLRFRKVQDVWKKQASFTLSLDDARALAATLASWAPDDHG